MTKLTKRQRDTYEALKSEYTKTGKPVAARRVAELIGIKHTTAYDRFKALNTHGYVDIILEGGRNYYVPTNPAAEYEVLPEKTEYIDHGLGHGGMHESRKNPLTWDEVDRVRETLKYKTGGKHGTPLKVLKRYDQDMETGVYIRQVETVEPLKAYPHGVLCTKRWFIRWIDIALYFRNPRRVIGETLGRRESR